MRVAQGAAREQVGGEVLHDVAGEQHGRPRVEAGKVARRIDRRGEEVVVGGVAGHLRGLDGEAGVHLGRARPLLEEGGEGVVA